METEKNANGAKVETALGICPNCEKQVTINSSELIIFCDFCNKPFNVNEAIGLFAEGAARNKASKRPSDEVITKFNAILAQDYKLANEYLEDVIEKEYPPECRKYISFRFTDALREELICYSMLSYLHSFPDRLKKIYSVNSFIAGMFYQILCQHINALLRKECHAIYSGGLASLKINVGNINNIMHMDSLNLYNLERDIRESERFSNEYNDGKDYDDKYISDIISVLSSFTNIIRFGSQVAFLIKILSNFCSPEKRKEIEKTAEMIIEKRRKWYEEIEFWQRYIAILKLEGVSEALTLLESKEPSTARADELQNFKKGFWGVKYLGNISSLNAEDLARKVVKF